VVVRDDEDALPDPRSSCGRRKVGVTRQRVPPLAIDRQVRELDPEERRTGNVRLQVQVAPRLPLGQRVGAVDEPVLDDQ